MKNDILTEKLRYYAERGNIEMNRCIEIAHAADAAILEHSRSREISSLSLAMVRCCGSDEDEAAYFRCAVDSLLQEKWGADAHNSAVLTGLMDMAYREILNADSADVEEAVSEDDEEAFFDKFAILDERYVENNVQESANDVRVGDLGPAMLPPTDANMPQAIGNRIQELSESHRFLRADRKGAIENLEFCELAGTLDGMDEIRDDQITLLVKEIERLRSLIEENSHSSYLDEYLLDLIKMKSAATTELEFEKSAEIETQIFKHFGQTLAKMAGQVGMLSREIQEAKDRRLDTDRIPTELPAQNFDPVSNFTPDTKKEPSQSGNHVIDRQTFLSASRKIVNKFCCLVEDTRFLPIFDAGMINCIGLSKDKIRACIEFLAQDAIAHPNDHPPDVLQYLRSVYMMIADFQEIDKDDELIVQWINSSKRCAPYRFEPGTKLLKKDTITRPDYLLMIEFRDKYSSRSLDEKCKSVLRY